MAVMVEGRAYIMAEASPERLDACGLQLSEDQMYVSASCDCGQGRTQREGQFGRVKKGYWGAVEQEMNSKNHTFPKDVLQLVQT